MDQALLDRIVESLLGRPLVSNAFRGTLVEAILASVLEPDWRWCADGWGSYDFERLDGVGLEVKQSAAIQDWHRPGDKFNSGRFDIAARKGRWEGADWVESAGRAAAIYIFAWHPVTERDLADHRDQSQWEFYPVLAVTLPNQKSIALSRVRQMAEPTEIDVIAGRVRVLLNG